MIGASGSGKSSLVRAGVLPKLSEPSAAGRWHWLRLTPGGLGDDPFIALSAALFPALEKSKLTVREMATQLQQRGNIDELAQQYRAHNPVAEQLILFIDQFEELFTLVADNHRQRFIYLLEKAVQSRYLRVILTVRADFHEHCLNYPALADLINTGAWHLASPDLVSLWQMIYEPANAAGLQFEDGLVEQILRDTGSGSGALALMAFALEQLYLACVPSRILTRAAYEQLGGVSQAIGRHAQETFDKLDKDAQNVLGEVFAELVTVDPEHGVATRKRAELSHIGQTPAASALIEAFTEARLLVKSELNGSDTGKSVSARQTVVEVAHEALLSHWDLLKNWLDERSDDFCLLRRVCTEAEVWEWNGRPEAHLWPDERLAQVYAMQKALKPRLSESVVAFIRPEAERLLEKLNAADLSHQQRQRIGMRLAEIGDPRPGIDVNAYGFPEIEWCAVPPGRIILEDNAGIFDVAAFFYRQISCNFQAILGFFGSR